MGHSGGGGGHSNINRPARGLGRVPAAGHGGVRPLGTGGRVGVRHPDRGIRGGVCDRRLSARPERPAPRGALGHGPALRRVLCGGPPARGRGRVVLGTVQCPGGAGHGLFDPSIQSCAQNGTRAAKGWPRALSAGRWGSPARSSRSLSGRHCGALARYRAFGARSGRWGRSPCPSASWAVPC